MSRRRHRSSAFIPVVSVSIAVAVWIYDASKPGGTDSSSGNGTVSNFPTDIQQTSDGSNPERNRKYEVHSGCTLASDRGNDGDSFRVNFPSGRKEIVRLYFVDTPESAFKSYGGGRNNHRRIAQQAGEMGNITSEQAVGIGKIAKDFTITQLSNAPFTVHTEWDSPFKDRRYHAFVTLQSDGKTRYLHELLVENGYARIHTKGATMPGGDSERTQENHLLDLERVAKSNRVGAWGL